MVTRSDFEKLTPGELYALYTQLQAEKAELEMMRQQLEKKNLKARQRTIELFGKMIDVKKAQKIIQAQHKELEEKNQEIIRQKAALERTFQKFRQRTIELFGKMIDLKKAYNIINQQKKEIENQRKQLREINAAKDKFFSIIAHDLKNPIAGFIGLTEVMTSQADDLSPKEMKEFSTMIYDSARQLYSLLDNLLHWARSQTGSIKVNLRETDLNKTIAEIQNQLSTVAEMKGITIRISAPEQAIVFADPDMLNAIVRNLLSNAIKFSNSNSYIDLLVHKGDKVIQLTVKDYGVGIPSEDLPKLFRIDHNPSRIGTAKEKGTGLGLVLCKEFIERMGGTITVESELGKGASFIISIPIAPTKNFKSHGY